MYEKNYKTSVLNQKVAVKKRFSWKRFSIILGVIIVIAGFCYLLRLPRFQISDITVEGTYVIDQEEVRSVVQSDLAGWRLWIFPRTSSLLVNDKAIEAKLKKQFTRIETVVVKRDNLHTLSVSIKEFDPVYLWCTETDACYFMDMEGVVYGEAPVFSGSAYPKIFTGAPLEALPFVGIKEADLTQIAEFQKRLSEINITPIAFRLRTPRELTIDFLHNKTIAELRVDRATSTDTSLEYLFSGIRTEPLSSLFASEHKKLLYIDVRFSNKVVYKFDQENVESTESKVQ